MLKIEQNIEEAVYIKQRRNSLLNARNAEPEIPLSLKEHIRLKDHQREGVAASAAFPSFTSGNCRLPARG